MGTPLHPDSRVSVALGPRFLFEQQLNVLVAEQVGSSFYLHPPCQDDGKGLAI